MKLLGKLTLLLLRLLKLMLMQTLLIPQRFRRIPVQRTLLAVLVHLLHRLLLVLTQLKRLNSLKITRPSIRIQLVALRLWLSLMKLKLRGRQIWLKIMLIKRLLVKYRLTGIRLIVLRRASLRINLIWGAMLLLQLLLKVLQVKLTRFILML